jgi:hypothetical protein
MIEKVEKIKGLQAVKFERFNAKKMSVLCCDRIKKIAIGSAEKISDQIVQFYDGIGFRSVAIRSAKHIYRSADQLNN